MYEIYIASWKLEIILLNHQKKNDKKKPWCEWKRISFMWDLLIFSNRSCSYEFGNLLNYFWGNDSSFFSLLTKRFGHFNLLTLKISSHFKWEFFMNAKNVVVFFVILCGANETSDRCLICPTQVVNVWWKIFFLKFYLNFLMFHKKRGAFYFCVKVKFSLHIFVIILEMILMSENQAKNLLKTSK